MANDLNDCKFIGRLGQDPEVRAVGDKSVTTFSIAVGRSWNNKSTGEKVERTEWIRINAWGGLGKICADYLTKGSQAYFQGEWRTTKFQDRDSGKDRYSTELELMNMQLLGGRQEGANTSAASQAPASSPSPSTPATGGEFDDDIPFAPFMNKTFA